MTQLANSGTRHAITTAQLRRCSQPSKHSSPLAWKALLVWANKTTELKSTNKLLGRAKESIIWPKTFYQSFLNFCLNLKSTKEMITKKKPADFYNRSNEGVASKKSTRVGTCSASRVWSSMKGAGPRGYAPVPHVAADYKNKNRKAQKYRFYVPKLFYEQGLGTKASALIEWVWQK